MNSKILIISTFLVLVIYAVSTAQNVIEIGKPEISGVFVEVMEKTKDLGKENPEEAIRLYNEALPKISGIYERFTTIFWGLTFTYAEIGLYQNGLDSMLKGQKEKLYFPIMTGERKWPPFVTEWEKLDGFVDFIEENNRLRSEAQKDAKTEYFIQLPKTYDQTKIFPLLIVLTGGFGSHIGLSEDWQSQKLTSDYIVAYTQGSRCQGSFLFSYEQENYKEEIRTIYDQIIQQYAVDTTRVILGGPSAGGARSLILSLDKVIPTKGLLLAFPVIPQELGEEKIKKMADSGLRIAMITGENDFGLKKQKEAVVLFDKNELPNRFLIYPEKGHEYPDDFIRQIDLSLNFIFQN